LRGRRTAMSDYWNIEVAFADSHAVPVRFNTAATGLGKALDPNADTEDLPAESVVEVPFWMVPPLVQRGMVTPLLPAAFRAAVRKEIEAGPSSFDLRTCCAHWYELAHRVNSLPGEDHGLGPLSLQTFAARYRDVVVRHAWVQTDTSSPAVMGMTNEERVLVGLGRVVSHLHERWALKPKEGVGAQERGRKRPRV